MRSIAERPRARSARCIRALLVIGALAAAAAALLASAASSTIARRALPARQPITRYSLVHGCYTLRSPQLDGLSVAAGGPFRMQPAALGIYLLYGRRGDYLTDHGTGTLQEDETPSSGSQWRVDGSSSRGFTITNVATAARLPVRFLAAGGCATYPEAQVDARGPVFTGASPEAAVRGTVEGHAHITAFEFFGGDWHCGRPWSPYGAPYALPASCAPDQQGTNGAVEAFLDFGLRTRPSDMHGWPTFVDWPSPTALAEEGDYYTGIERAWKAGLRVMVTNLVDNEALCSIMTKRHNPCNDMAAVRIQSRDLYALQDYIDAQSGGPGRGWFRIVTDPFQARRVINAGKLAVVEGIEVSRIFGCGEYNDVPQCDDAQIDAGLKEVRDLGVRTFFPIHEFNNAFGGTKMIAGEQGVIVNAGNRDETGSFWTLQPCPARDQDAEQLTLPATGALAQLLNGPVSSLLRGNPVPIYSQGPQCNTRGLTALGAYVIRQMIRQHLIIQLDHMSSRAATAALSIAERDHYAGVVSAHCCNSPQLFGRIYHIGGFISEPQAPPSAFVHVYRLDRSQNSPRYDFGFGYGSDENGLAQQPGPDVSNPIHYPFRSFDGRVTFTRETWGQREFDLNRDGVANYGMYADWLQAVQQAGGRAAAADMFNGAEAFLEMWERAYGVPAASCRSAAARFSETALGSSLRLGETTTQALYSAGQPTARRGRSYGYCVHTRGGGVAAVVGAFDARGRLALIASSARGDLADGVGPGDPIAKVRGGVRELLPGVIVASASGGRILYGVTGGHVRFVAITAPSELHNTALLQRDLQSAGIIRVK